MRIAIGGFHIESCTFSPLMSGHDDFLVFRDQDLLRQYDFLSRFADVQAIPLVRARALPGGPVDPDFYTAIKAEMVAKLEQNAPWDGVFLHLHGAVYVQGMEDAEGDLIRAVRGVVGPDCPIAASYDLHGNVSRTVFDGLDVLSAYRTAPHVDWYETLERAFTLLVDGIRTRTAYHKAYIPVPILLPGEQTSTEWEPAASLYRAIENVVADPAVVDASILVGYVWADEARASASVVAYGTDQAAVNQAAITLAQRFWDVRHAFAFGVPALPVDECIQTAVNSSARPVVISDSGDNPTAGGAGDVPYVLERLIALDAANVLYASIVDAAAVQMCEATGTDHAIELSLGGKLDTVNGSPLETQGRIVALGALTWGSEEQAGATRRPISRAAVVRIGTIDCIITDRRTAFHRLDDFRAVGLDPTAYDIVVVKIGYLEPELKQLAAEALLALSPGAVNQVIQTLPFERIRRPMYPFDRDMTWNPTERTV